MSRNDSNAGTSGGLEGRSSGASHSGEDAVREAVGDLAVDATRGGVRVEDIENLQEALQSMMAPFIEAAIKATAASLSRTFPSRGELDEVHTEVLDYASSEPDRMARHFDAVQGSGNVLGYGDDGSLKRLWVDPSVGGGVAAGLHWTGVKIMLNNDRVTVGTVENLCRWNTEGEPPYPYVGIVTGSYFIASLRDGEHRFSDENDPVFGEEKAWKVAEPVAATETRDPGYKLVPNTVGDIHVRST